MKLVLLLLISILWPSSDRMQSVTRTVYMMGTSCTLTVMGKDRSLLLEQLELLVRTLEDTERELSTWQESSALSTLNHQSLGVSFTVDPSLCRLFKELLHWVDETDGAFEPAIGALVEAYGIRDGGRHPLKIELKSARIQSGMHGYRMDEASCRITRMSDVIIDCGAFGKGEALERLRSVSYREGIDSWLVNLGGQVAVHGMPPGAKEWDVDIAHPILRKRPVFEIHLNSGSLATSGGSERDLRVFGQRQSHILDPRSGLPAAFGGSVSVWHQSALVADILSTALYVMGPDKGMEWAEERDLAVCYLFLSGAEIESRASHAFHERFGDPVFPGNDFLGNN